MADKAKALSFKLKDGSAPVTIYSHDIKTGQDKGDAVTLTEGKSTGLDIDADTYVVARPASGSVDTEVEITLAEGSARTVEVDVATDGTPVHRFELVPGKPALTGMAFDQHRLTFRLGGDAPPADAAVEPQPKE